METTIEYFKRRQFETLRGKAIVHRARHPWRDTWQFPIIHGARVERLALDLVESEGSPFSAGELLSLRVAALVHDVGCVRGREGHAKSSREIVASWLEARPGRMSAEDRLDEAALLDLIEGHSDKENRGRDSPALSILKDADLLDEIGLMSVFMASDWIRREEPFFFSRLKERVETCELDFCDRGFALLKTESAKKILIAKRTFIAGIVTNLGLELRGNEDLERELEAFERGKVLEPAADQ